MVHFSQMLLMMSFPCTVPAPAARFGQKNFRTIKVNMLFNLILY
jgi:hypothetical protein